MRVEEYNILRGSYFSWAKEQFKNRRNYSNFFFKKWNNEKTRNWQITLLTAKFYSYKFSLLSDDFFLFRFSKGVFLFRPISQAASGYQSLDLHGTNRVCTPLQYPATAAFCPDTSSLV